MAKYLIIEIQKFADGTIAVPPVHTEETYFAAASTFHSICSIAAASEVPVHSVVLLTETGQTQGLESFNHTDTLVE